MKFSLSLFLLSLLSFQCVAGDETGTVRFQHGQYGSSSTSAGRMYFFLDGGSKNNSPVCATFAGGDRWVIDNNWPAAKMQLSILLAAKMAGKSVHIRGSNDCNVAGDSETAIDIVIN